MLERERAHGACKWRCALRAELAERESVEMSETVEKRRIIYQRMVIAPR